jgi:hypothetical protein
VCSQVVAHNMVVFVVNAITSVVHVLTATWQVNESIGPSGVSACAWTHIVFGHHAARSSRVIFGRWLCRGLADVPMVDMKEHITQIQSFAVRFRRSSHPQIDFDISRGYPCSVIGSGIADVLL